MTAGAITRIAFFMRIARQLIEIHVLSILILRWIAVPDPNRSMSDVRTPVFRGGLFSQLRRI